MVYAMYAIDGTLYPRTFCALFIGTNNNGINHSIFRLGISPEGTRKKVDYWKTGFYYIAKKADVPIVSVTLNYRDKNTNFSKPFFPTDNMDEDIKKLKMFYKGVLGKVEKNS